MYTGREDVLLLREGCPAPTAPLPASGKRDDEEARSPVWPARDTACKLVNTTLSFLRLPGKETSCRRQEWYQPASEQPGHPSLGPKASWARPEAEQHCRNSTASYLWVLPSIET